MTPQLPEPLTQERVKELSDHVGGIAADFNDPELRTAAAALAELAVMTWQDISTAPKDGEFLGITKWGGIHIYEGQTVGGDGQLRWFHRDGDGYDYADYMIGWMPLPSGLRSGGEHD